MPSDRRRDISRQADGAPDVKVAPGAAEAAAAHVRLDVERLNLVTRQLYHARR